MSLNPLIFKDIIAEINEIVPATQMTTGFIYNSGFLVKIRLLSFMNGHGREGTIGFFMVISRQKKVNRSFSWPLH